MRVRSNNEATFLNFCRETVKKTAALRSRVFLFFFNLSHCFLTHGYDEMKSDVFVALK